MTSAKQDLRQVMAERFGDDLVPLDEEVQPDAGQATSRARFVAMLHAVIAWFLEHPEIPVPRTVQLHARVDDVLVLEQLAQQHGAETYGRQVPQFDVELSGLDTGTLTSIIVAVRGPDVPL